MKNEILFEKITDQVIKSLEGAGQWSKCWANVLGNVPHNGATGHSYSGINWLHLSLAGYKSPQWLTFKQLTALGGSIKGKKGVGYNVIRPVQGTYEDKQGDKQSFYTLKNYTVWNVEEIDGLDKSKLVEYDPTDKFWCEDQDMVASFRDELGLSLEFGGNTACFIPSVDHIKMPRRKAFKTDNHFDSTFLHELVHWTGHKSRLDRLDDRSKRGYAFEELVAELGSAMLGSIVGLPYEGLQHGEYIKSWLKAFDGDIKYVYDASKEARKACEYIIENSPKTIFQPKKVNEVAA